MQFLASLSTGRHAVRYNKISPVHIHYPYTYTLLLMYSALPHQKNPVLPPYLISIPYARHESPTKKNASLGETSHANRDCTHAQPKCSQTYCTGSLGDKGGFLLRQLLMISPRFLPTLANYILRQFLTCPFLMRRPQSRVVFCTIFTEFPKN